MQLTVPKLLSLLNSNKEFLDALFVKRAMGINESLLSTFTNEATIQLLLNNNLIIQDEGVVELEDEVLSFFENILGLNEEIEIGKVGELIENITQYIHFYSLAKQSELKQKYLNKLDRVLKKIPLIINRNLLKLYSHIHITYKSASEHAIKKAELDLYKGMLQKLLHIDEILEHTLAVEKDFFNHTAPQKTLNLYFALKLSLDSMRISLLDLQRQVVDYINLISPDVGFIKHITTLKTLKNNFELFNKTNLKEVVVSTQTPTSFLNRRHYTTQLKHLYACSVDFAEFVSEYQLKSAYKTTPEKVNQTINETLLTPTQEIEYVVDFESLHQHFLESSDDLYTFVMQQTANETVEDGITLFCNMATLYAKEYHFSDNFATKDGYTHLLIRSTHDRT